MGFIKTSCVVLVTAIVVALLPVYLQPKLKINIRGSVAPGWERVEQVFRSQVERGDQQGGGFAVYYKGEKVVDLVGGYADPAERLPWTEKTVSQFYSTTKGVSAVVIALLEERGLLKYKDPVVKYWPEFAANGKEKITIEQLFTHQAGLHSIEEPFTIEDLKKNNPIVSKATANQKPGWTPGEGVGYHAISIGFYHDQIVRRVDPKHRSLSQFFREELAEPLGLDFYVGLPLKENWRCAPVIQQGLTGALQEVINNPEIFNFMSIMFDKSHLFWKTANNPVELQDDLPNDPIFREAPIPSMSGFGTPESVAKLYGIVSNGGIYKGKKILSERQISSLNKVVVTGKDKVLNLDVTYGKGFWLIPNKDNTSMTIGTPGAGGQMGYGDLKYKLGWGYLSNHHKLSMETDLYKELWTAMYDTVFEIENESK